MISQYLGFDSDYIIIGLSAVVLILLILIIVNIAQMRKLKKAYKVFMSGKNGKNLEDTLIKRLDQVDTLLEANNEGPVVMPRYPGPPAHPGCTPGGRRAPPPAGRG